MTSMGMQKGCWWQSGVLVFKKLITWIWEESLVVPQPIAPIATNGWTGTALRMMFSPRDHKIYSYRRKFRVVSNLNSIVAFESCPLTALSIIQISLNYISTQSKWALLAEIILLMNFDTYLYICICRALVIRNNIQWKHGLCYLFYLVSSVKTYVHCYLLNVCSQYIRLCIF